MDKKMVHILLVEDDENHAELVRRGFESRSEEVNLTVVGTLKEARTCLGKNFPDLLIVDLRLPDGEGLDLLPVGKEDAGFPVMVMTSHGDEHRAVEAMKAGALDYVVKSKETLLDMAHLAERALREWEAVTHRKEAEKLQDLQKKVLEKIVAGDPKIDILNAICTHVESMVPLSVCSMMVWEESTNSLRVLAAPSAPENLCAALNGLKPGERAGSCGTAAYTGKPVFVFDVETDPRWTGLRDVAREFGIRGCWSVPIVSEKKKTLGTFAISHPNPRAPTPFHRQLLETASYMAGITIQKRAAEDTLRAIVEGTAAVTSADFFRTLLRHLALALQVPYAFIAECVDSTNTRVRTLAFLNRDTFVEDVEYALEGTPCEHVIAGKICYYSKDVQRMFPQDKDLVDLGVQSYLGLPLQDSTAKVIGHLVIMSDHSVQFDTQTESLLKIFASRAGAELERMQAGRALQESHERLHQLTHQLCAAEEAERKRIARELHDQFGQTLTLLKFELAELADCVTEKSPATSHSLFFDRIHSMNALVDSTIHSVRHISSILRPSILDDFGLISALEWLGEDFEERTHLPCTLSIDPHIAQISLKEAQTTTLFRIAQELLTNVLRHAQATQVELVFSLESNGFMLHVRDNGQGITEEQVSGADSFGLRGIRERAWLLGGDFILQGQPGKGTSAKVRIPIE